MIFVGGAGPLFGGMNRHQPQAAGARPAEQGAVAQGARLYPFAKSLAEELGASGRSLRGS